METMPIKMISRTIIPPEILQKMEYRPDLEKVEKNGKDRKIKRKVSESDEYESVSDGDSWGSDTEVPLKEKIVDQMEIDAKKFEFSEDIVKMKKYDENGLLIDGYDYY